MEAKIAIPRFHDIEQSSLSIPGCPWKKATKTLTRFCTRRSASFAATPEQFAAPAQLGATTAEQNCAKIRSRGREAGARSRNRAAICRDCAAQSRDGGA